MYSPLRNIFSLILLLCVSIPLGFGQTTVNDIGVVGLIGMTEKVVDQDVYHLKAVIRNNDLNQVFFTQLTIFAAIDGGEPFVLGDHLWPGAPIAPGDTGTVILPKYQFPALMPGGGITHDIIVWPMAPAVVNPDSFKINFHYYLAAAGPARHLNISDGGNFPLVIEEGQLYDFDLHVTNLDPDRVLQKEITVEYRVNNGSSVLLKKKTPTSYVFPGDSVAFPIKNHLFEPQFFVTGGGGGITHDIIVWPMKIGTITVDTLYIQSTYYSIKGASFSLFNGGQPNGTGAFGYKVNSYPNPVSTILTVEVADPASGKVSIEIYDLSGRRVLYREIHASRDQIDVSKLEPGLYTLRLSQGDFHETLRLIRQ